MDYQPQDPRYPDKTINLATASLVVGVIGLVLCPIPIFGLCLPAIAMILALLSRGKELSFRGSGKIGMVISVLGLLACCAITVFLFTFAIKQMGGTEQFFQEYQKQLEYQLDQPKEL